MIFYYLLVLSLPLVEHAVFGARIGGVTVVKYIGLICLGYALVTGLNRRRGPEFLGTPQARAFMAFFGLVVLSYVLHGSGAADAGTTALIAYVSHVGFFVLTLLVVGSVARLRRVLLVAIGSMALASLYVLREWQGGSSLYGAGYRPGYVTGDPNFYAASTLLCLPLAFGWAVDRRRGWERVYCLGCLFLGLAGSMVAASRGGFVGLLAAMAFLVWHSPRRGRNFALGAGALALFLIVSPTSPLQRIMNPIRGDEEATDVRLKLWAGALNMVADAPLTGFGLASFKVEAGAYADLPEDVRFAAHNAYLEIAVEMGLPGLVALLALIYLSCRSADRVRRQTRRTGPPLLHRSALGIEAGLVGFAVSLMFVSGLFLKMFWLMLFLTMCLPALVPRERVEQAREAA
jgi:putative inorganic carbon (HCO3(-)) transporter